MIMSQSIVNLPTELVLEIGQYIVLIDPLHYLLSFLSQTCRRFHDIFTPSIDTYHVRSISESSISTKFIAVGQGQTNISDFSSLNGDFEEMSFKLRAHTVDDIRCFRNLISRANSISRIEVDVGQREASRRVLVCLLNTCVQRPDLHLRIVEPNGVSWNSRDLDGGPFLFEINKNNTVTEPTPQKREPVKASWKDVFLNVLSPIRGHKTTKENTPPPIFSSTCSRMEVMPRKPPFEVPRPRMTPRLTGLWIESDCPFSASMYPWTRDIMNTAPLTHLSISRSTLTLFDWSKILSLISIPTLTYLAIGRVNVAFPDLSDFFNQHPSLQVIDLSDNELIGTVSFLIAPKSSFLPRLNTLVATPEYIYPFIRCQQDGYFQELGAYGLRAVSETFYNLNVAGRFRAVFELLASKPRTHLSISLCRVALYSLVQWLMNTSSIIGRFRRLPGIWKVVLVAKFFSRELLGEFILTLLAERARGMNPFVFLNNIFSQGDPFTVDRLFRVVCPDLQLIEYKQIPDKDSDWSMII